MKGSEKILEVNFKNLDEKEKRNCQEFLAKQDTEIIFEEEEGTGSFVTHIKFVRSPKKYSKPPRSRSPPKGRSTKSKRIELSRLSWMDRKLLIWVELNFKFLNFFDWFLDEASPGKKRTWWGPPSSYKKKGSKSRSRSPENFKASKLKDWFLDQGRSLSHSGSFRWFLCWLASLAVRRGFRTLVFHFFNSLLSMLLGFFLGYFQLRLQENSEPLLLAI